MKEGFEITEEIEQIATGYDFNYRYIDNYGQMKECTKMETTTKVWRFKCSRLLQCN